MLERARNDARLSVQDVATQCAVHPTTVRRWETGETGPKPPTIMFLGGLYGASPEQVGRWRALSLGGDNRGWFEGSTVPANLRVLAGNEAYARLIETIELEYIPGLLQVPEYQKAVQTAQLPVDPETSANARDVRAKRQAALFGQPHPPAMHFIIGPAALLHLDGWPEVKKLQIARLREVAAMPTVDVRIIVGFHAAMLGGFTIITPAAEIETRRFACVETVDGIRYVETPDVVSGYVNTFAAVRKQSVSIEEYLK